MLGAKYLTGNFDVGALIFKAVLGETKFGWQKRDHGNVQWRVIIFLRFLLRERSS